MYRRTKRPASGPKRTSSGAPAKATFDPKRTLALALRGSGFLTFSSRPYCCCKPPNCLGQPFGLSAQSLRRAVHFVGGCPGCDRAATNLMDVFYDLITAVCSLL